MDFSALGSYPVLAATSFTYCFLSLGHTLKGLSQFQHPSLAQLPLALRGAAKIGWYEGSIFFFISGILNYKWSQTGLVDMADKSIASLLITMLFGAGVSYWRSREKSTAAILFVTGVMQAVGARQAA